MTNPSDQTTNCKDYMHMYSRAHVKSIYPVNDKIGSLNVPNLGYEMENSRKKILCTIENRE